MSYPPRLQDPLVRHYVELIELIQVLVIRPRAPAPAHASPEANRHARRLGGRGTVRRRTRRAVDAVTRSESVTVRFNASELATLDRLAAERGCSRSDALRDAVRDTKRLRQLVAVWEMGALAGLLALGLDDETSERVGARIRELSAEAGR